MNLTTTTRLGLLALAAAATVGVAACSSGSGGHDGGHMNSGAATSDTGGSGTGSANAAQGQHNKADVAFATDMIPHHSQAVEMADMALSTSKNAEIVTLAKAIKGAQDPEIKTMSSWLTSWGEPIPTEHSGMGGHDMGMPGMMSDAAMAELGKATGATFDKLWLTMMTEHHTGAIAMAKTELADGSSTDAKSLARSIISDQTSEIAIMKKLIAAY